MPRQAFIGKIPEPLLYDPEYDMWIKQSGDEVFIGATSYGIFLAGEIVAFTSKPNGAECTFGRGIATVECAKTVLAVHAPLSIIILEGNERLEASPTILNHDPYDEAWMVRGRPIAWELEHTRLVDANVYRSHIQRMEPSAKFL
ncbi:MAG: glycine cleavage system protein H [Rhodocyclaceae bacterium]|nr:glycine cleavage system protein H [Rhodocyclaceae bacterium]